MSIRHLVYIFLVTLLFPFSVTAETFTRELSVVTPY